MNSGPVHGDDAGLMAALFNRRRQWTPLSADQIKLVDEFLAGRLAGEAASAAERLIRDNAFAAERVMERRLLQQAESSPAPPRALTEAILREAERATARRTPTKRRFGFALLSWKTAGAAAVAVALVVLGGEWLLNPVRSPNGIGREAEKGDDATAPSLQVAMATVANRDLLIEPSDLKLRSEPGRSGTNPREASDTSTTVVPRFYDIEVPADVLAGWLARARNGSQIPVAELAPLVGSLQTFNSSRTAAIVFDEVLRTRLPPETPLGVRKQTSVMQLRIYDLGQQPADDLRKALNIQASQKLAPGYFVTVKP